MNQKNKAHKCYKRYNININYDNYSRIRKEFKTLNRFLYNNYMLDIESQISSNPKIFWTFVDSKRKHKGYPSPMCHENQIASSEEEVCNIFAKFFQEMYVDSGNNSFANDATNMTMIHNTSLLFSSDEIIQALQSLDKDTSAGPDGVPAIVLKNCAEVLCDPLKQLFNASLKIGIFPTAWKTSFLIPIFKKVGNRNTVSNYRGIAKLSTVPKVFECMVQKHLIFNVKGSIIDNQHGFYPGRSTSTNLVLFTHYVVDAVEKKKQVEVIYTDFSKAFDVIDHQILLSKLKKLNCNAVSLSWLSSYLSNRTQFVRIGNSLSEAINVSSGVPQGSHIGPLLFLLFVNDIGACFKFCNFLMYADDLKIFTAIESELDLPKIQEDLHRLEFYIRENNLKLNLAKCKHISFHRKKLPIYSVYQIFNFPIEKVDEISDLGIIFTSKLSFSRHIDKIIAKASSMLGFIKRNTKDFYDPITLKILYCSFVRSHLEYASVVWSPYFVSDADRIESVQKKFLLFALRRQPRDRSTFKLAPYTSRCKLIGLETLQSRRNIVKTLFCRDVICNKLDCPTLLNLYGLCVPQRALRNTDLLHIPFCRTLYGQNEPVVSTARALNDHADNFDFNVSRKVFRARIT